jgi:hypothetical protein
MAQYLGRSFWMKASGERSFFDPPKDKKISGKSIVAGQNFGETHGEKTLGNWMFLQKQDGSAACTITQNLNVLAVIVNPLKLIAKKVQ